MKIAFNPSTVAALTTPPNNKDITFDLRGRNIFARGVKFYGTDTNTWRDIKINNVSIGSHTLDLRNGSNTTLTNTNGVVTINSTWRPVVDNLTSDSTTSSLSAKQGKVLKALIDGKSDSDHNHDGRYLKLTGGTMAGNALITFADSGSWDNGKKPQGARGGLYWTGQSDYAKLYAEETVGDNLDLVIQFGDDNSNGLSIRNKANTQTSYISAGGVITTGTFKGNLDWSYITNKPASYTPSAHTHAWNSLTHSSTTENQAILTNGKANGWKLQTLNIARWDNAANNAHSHANKSVLDGITSALVNSWNTAYNFVSNITGTDTDKVINKWEEIVNFLAGITEDNKLNTLLNSKLSVYELADNTNVGTIKNNGIYYSTTDASSRTLINSPFNTGFAFINMTSYDEGDDLRRSRLAFNVFGEIKVSDDRDQANTAETWYNVLTSKNSGINGSTIKLNGTSITVYSSGTADGRYVKKSGDTMQGVLTIDTTNFGALTIKRNDDANGASIQFRGKSSVYGYIGLNNSTKDKQFLRWSSDTSRIYTILDTSSTYISNGKGVINGTTITQVDNATNSTNSTNARKLVNWYSARPTSLNAQFGDGSLRIFYATSSTTEGKPAEDSHILHLAWDNTGGWDAQLAVHIRSGKVSTRAQNGGTWQPWKTLAFTTDIPSSLKNPYSFNVFGVVYDGSAVKTVTTSNFISQVNEGMSTITDGTMLITSYASNSGFADTNAVNVPYKRKAIHLWEYIKAKTDSLYATKGHNHDDRYYTESEVNSLLSRKLDSVNLTTGNWNPRGYHLAADYHYNGGELSISESGGKIHVTVDGHFWQNEGQYRVLDTSDAAGLKSNLTVHQYLSATDAAWYPLVWGGNSHNNTSDSTGAVNKSYDKLSWQTSSQTLYATNIQTNNIKNLSIGGGIYWNPYVESASEGSDAASITLVRSGVAGGTTLVLSQMNDTNDTIQFKTNTAARLYHNSYPILTTQNTYVSNNKGYINGTEITQVNNANKWITARTFTVGNTSKSVDGSSNVSWSLSEIGAASSNHNHDNRYVRKWTGVYGNANKFLKLVISDEKGWIRLEVSDSNIALRGGYGIYIIGWGYHGNNSTDTLFARCLYANDSRYTTALKVVRTSRNNYDFYFQFASGSSYPSYTINYSNSIISIDYTVTAIDTIPTATWTSSLSALQLNASQVDWSGITNKPSTFNPAAHTHTVFKNNLMIKGTNGTSDSASIHLGIGDSDTGFKWISDGVCQIYANNTAVGQWTSGGMNWFKNPTVSGNKVWNAGNDGSGSGLDSDLVDGLHASRFPIYYNLDMSSTSNHWYKLGTARISESNNIMIHIYSGSGWNSKASQNAYATLMIKTGYNPNGDLTREFGATMVNHHHSNMTYKLISPSNDTVDIWVKIPWEYSSGWYSIHGEYSSYTHSGASQSAEPTGNAQTGVETLTNAYTSSNVASATKLATPRTIWGQSFDGTADVNGTIYINNSNSANGAIRLNNNINSNARISAIDSQVIFNTGNAIRFGGTAWDQNQWAGLKYEYSNKTIYLGIADGSIFTANSAQSGGTLSLTSINTLQFGVQEAHIGYNGSYSDPWAGLSTNFKFGGKLAATHIYSNEGFYKNGSSNSYVLLGGGGHKAISDFAISTHTHGLLHSDLTVTLANTTTDSGWSMINSSYNGFLLKSILTQRSAPNWIENNYAAGICFGGSDTKGVVSIAYNRPYIKFAGGNGSKPVWWIRLSGISGATYNLANFNADMVDGYHANGLLTALSNSNNGISITVGGTTKSISNINVNYAASAGNANTLDGIDSTRFLRQVVVPNNTENDFNTFSNMTLTGRGDPTTGASLKNAPWSGSGPAGGYGVLTYLFNGSVYGTQMAWGYSDNRIYIRNRYWDGSGGGTVWRTSWDKLALTSDIPTVTNYYWANVKISASSSTTTSPTVLNLTATNSIRMGNIVLEHTNEINSANDSIYLNPKNSGNVSLCVGGGKVGIGTMYPSQELYVQGYTHTKGFGIGIQYLSESLLLPNISPGDGYTYRCLEIGRSTKVSCIIADKVPLSGIRGILLRFMQGFDGQIVLLKDLENYGSGNGYFWVMPSECKIIHADNSNILINQNEIRNTYDDGRSRFFIYSAKYSAWIEFICSNIY